MILRSLEEITEKQNKMNGKTEFLILEIQENNIYHTYSLKFRLAFISML